MELINSWSYPATSHVDFHQSVSHTMYFPWLFPQLNYDTRIQARYLCSWWKMQDHDLSCVNFPFRSDNGETAALLRNTPLLPKLYFFTHRNIPECKKWTMDKNAPWILFCQVCVPKKWTSSLCNQQPARTSTGWKQFWRLIPAWYSGWGQHKRAQYQNIFPVLKFILMSGKCTSNV